MTTGIVFGTLLRDALKEWPSRNQLMWSLSNHTPVIFLECHRSPSRNPVSYIYQETENLYVLRSAFTLRSSRYGRRLPRLVSAIDGAWFERSLRSVGISRYIYWLTVADPVLALRIRSADLVYDCADPNFLPGRQAKFDAAESQIAARAALTFSTAHSLWAKMTTYNSKSFLLPNATSLDFHPSRTAHLPSPPLLTGRLGAVFGYLGTIDWRFDPTFVRAAARALPGCTFAIVGRVNSDQEDALAPLRQLPNVIMPGQVSYDDGRAWVAAFDVATIPFKIGATNDAINPVKMYMYLMAGLPIVTTDMAECRLNPFVRTATTPIDYVRLLQESISQRPPPDRDARISFARRNTWDIRANEALNILREHRLYGS